MRIRFSILMAGLLASACSGDATGPESRGDVTPSNFEPVEVTVRRGDVVTVPGTQLRIGLLDVTEDSRCPTVDPDGRPTLILCVWQGNADLLLELSAPGLAAINEILMSGFDPEIEYGPFLIRFFGLAPERVHGGEMDPAAYVATLRVVAP